MEPLGRESILGERENAPHFPSPNLLKRSPSFPKTFEPIVSPPTSLKTQIPSAERGTAAKKERTQKRPLFFHPGKQETGFSVKPKHCCPEPGRGRTSPSVPPKTHTTPCSPGRSYSTFLRATIYWRVSPSMSRIGLETNTEEKVPMNTPRLMVSAKS